MGRLLTILLVGLVCEAIGVVLLSRGLKEISSWFFALEDVQDPGSLTSKLRSRADPVSDLIWQTLTRGQQSSLTDPNFLPAQSKQILTDALNGVLRRGAFYDAKLFTDVPLSMETRQLLLQELRGNELVRLNRLLLQDAYPNVLVKQESKTMGASPVLHGVGRGMRNPHILLGVFFEALFFVSLLVLMSRADVSFIWPLTSLSFVVTTVAAQVYLHEQVSALRWSGVCLIMLGAALITWTEKNKGAAPNGPPLVQSSSQGALLP